MCHQALPPTTCRKRDGKDRFRRASPPSVESTTKKPTSRWVLFMVAWDHDHREIVDAFSSPTKFIAALRDVAPLLDAELPKRVEIWRGAVLSKNDRLRHFIGLSWTQSRNVACWFALREYVSTLQPSLVPIVLRANVDRAADKIAGGRRRASCRVHF
jgi:hypothetical protein